MAFVQGAFCSTLTRSCIWLCKCLLLKVCNIRVCALSVDECRNIILQYGVREVTASQVARVLGMMARTHSGLSDGIPLQVPF